MPTIVSPTNALALAPETIASLSRKRMIPLTSENHNKVDKPVERSGS
jgi:hypothetical protein